jgi:hypothetical protein
MTKTSRSVWLMIVLLAGSVLVGVVQSIVRLRSYWVAKYHGGEADSSA